MGGPGSCAVLSLTLLRLCWTLARLPEHLPSSEPGVSGTASPSEGRDSLGMGSAPVAWRLNEGFADSRCLSRASSLSESEPGVRSERKTSRATSRLHLLALQPFPHPSVFTPSLPHDETLVCDWQASYPGDMRRAPRESLPWQHGRAAAADRPRVISVDRADANQCQSLPTSIRTLVPPALCCLTVTSAALSSTWFTLRVCLPSRLHMLHFLCVAALHSLSGYSWLC